MFDSRPAISFPMVRVAAMKAPRFAEEVAVVAVVAVVAAAAAMEVAMTVTP